MVRGQATFCGEVAPALTSRAWTGSPEIATLAGVSQAIVLLRGDITSRPVDVIVNAANSSLLGGGGVDGAIHRAAGPELLLACQALGGCPTGEAKLTPGFRLPARYVIHTVGPVWRGGKHGEDRLLAACYAASLALATDHGCRTIAFPAISCGAYGYPLAQACAIAVAAIKAHLACETTINRVELVCFDDAVYTCYAALLATPVATTMPAAHPAPKRGPARTTVLEGPAPLGRRERIVGCLVGLVIGDALGVPVEFKSRAQLDAEPVHGMSGYGTYNQPPGTWSDDSSMALATAESLLGGYNPDDMMARFHAWSSRGYMTPHGEVFDIGNATHAAIARYARGEPPEAWGGRGESDNGNGSLMRIAPLSCFVHDQDIATIVGRSVEVSALTHAHPRSTLACAYLSLLLRGLLRGQVLDGALQAAAAAISPYLPAEEATHFSRLLSGSVLAAPRAAIASTGYVLHCLEASVWASARSADFREAVLLAVNLGDDTDTTGAVTGAICGAMFGLRALPVAWRTALIDSAKVHKLADDFADRILTQAATRAS